MKSRYAVLLGGALLAAGANAAGNPGKVWITVDQQAYAMLLRVAPGARAIASRDLVATSLAGRELVDRINVIEVDRDVLDPLSASIHTELHHCGGFMAFDTQDAALAALTPAPPLATATRPDYTITRQSLVTPLLGQQAAINITQTIQDFSALQNRYYTSSYGAQATDLLAAKWTALTAGRTDVTIQKVRRGSDAMSSVVLTIRGATNPDQVVIIGGHLDSINLTDANGSQQTARAPGADDDASGIASLTEALRVLMANNYRPAQTITLIGYSGEEAGLLGSQYIANDYRNRGVDVIGVLQLDMTNYKGSVGDIYLEDDYTDAQQNQFVQNLAQTYLPTLNVQHDRCGYACSDHASWTNNGYPASMPFEAKLGQDNPYIHSSRDTYANSGSQATHALKFSRLALAFAVELGDVAGTTPPPPPPPPPGPPPPTPPPSNGQCAAPWSATQVYNGGSAASENGTNYTANRWTQGDDPATHSGARGSGQPWTNDGACGGSTPPTPPPAPPPAPPPPTPPPAPPPTTPPPPPAPPSGSSCAAWVDGGTYKAGAVVSYQGQTYTAIVDQTDWAGAGWDPAHTPSLWRAGGACN
jgi:leucyl aminopeptidase